MILAVTLGEDKDETCYRVISPAYAGAPLSGMGAARQGGRFNPDCSLGRGMMARWLARQFGC